MRTIQGQQKVKIRQAKENYRRRLEWKLQLNNTRFILRGMRTITGFRSACNSGVEGSVNGANNSIFFFNRFDIGEETAGEIPLGQGCRSWWCAQSLCPPAMWSISHLNSLNRLHTKTQLNSLPSTFSCSVRK